MHLKQLWFKYSVCEPFRKSKERFQKFKETGDLQYIYKNELDKISFQHDVDYGDFKDLTRRTASDKILHDKAFNTAKNPKYDWYQRIIGSWFIIFLIKNIWWEEQLKIRICVIKISKRITQTNY